MAKEKNQQTPDSVDQIRNILFGEQIAIIEKRFAEMDKRVNASIDSISNKIDLMNKEIKSDINNIKNQHDSDTTEMSKQHSQELSHLENSLTNKITETEADLLNQIQSGLEKLDHSASHRNDIAKLLKEMADKLAD